MKAKTYQLDFLEDSDRLEYINYSIDMADYDTGIVPTVDDQILTLITCYASDYSYRWTVQAVKREEILRH